MKLPKNQENKASQRFHDPLALLHNRLVILSLALLVILTADKAIRSRWLITKPLMHHTITISIMRTHNPIHQHMDQTTYHLVIHHLVHQYMDQQATQQLTHKEVIHKLTAHPTRLLNNRTLFPSKKSPEVPKAERDTKNDQGKTNVTHHNTNIRRKVTPALTAILAISTPGKQPRSTCPVLTPTVQARRLDTRECTAPTHHRMVTHRHRIREQDTPYL